MGDLRNEFEAQSSGTTLSAANSGGGTDDAFSALTTTGSPATTFDNTWAWKGTRSWHVVVAAASTCYLQWTGQNTPMAGARVYVKNNATFVAAQDFISLRDAVGGACTVGFSASGQVTIKDSAGAGLKTYAPAANVTVGGPIIRVEFQVKPGTTTGNGTINGGVYFGDDVDPIDSFASAAVSARLSNIIEMRVGKITSATATMDMNFDGVALHTGDLNPIGPMYSPFYRLTPTPRYR